MNTDDTPIETEKMERINITMPPELLKILDSWAKRMFVDRSTAIRIAVGKMLEQDMEIRKIPLPGGAEIETIHTPKIMTKPEPVDPQIVKPTNADAEPKTKTTASHKPQPDKTDYCKHGFPRMLCKNSECRKI